MLPAGVSDFASPHSPPPWGSAAVFSHFHHPKILFPSLTNISDSQHRSLFTLECSGEPGGSGWCPRAVPAAVQVWRGAVCRELRAAGAAQGLGEGAQGSASCPGPGTGLSLGLRPCPELTGCVHCPENTLTPGPASLCPWDSDPISLRTLVMTFCGSPSSLGERTLTSK